MVDPELPGTYLLGVECDGATYHSSRCARERDRLRQEVLEGLGWRLYRIWSTEWWLNPKAEKQRLLDALRRAQTTPRPTPAPPPPPTPPPALGEAPSFEEQLSAGSNEPDLPEHAVPFPTDELPLFGDLEAFRDPRTRRQISQCFKALVEAMGPVHFDHVGRLVIAGWGIKRMGKNIRQTLENALNTLPPEERPVRRGDWLWPAGIAPDTWRGIRIPTPHPSAQRSTDQIPPEEIANAAEWVLGRALSIEQEDLERETARVFGFLKVKRKVKAGMMAGIAHLVATGRARLEGTTLKVVE